MLNWHKAIDKRRCAFADGDLDWDGYTPDGFFYRLGTDDSLILMTNNISGAALANIRCVKYDQLRRFRLYSYKPSEVELNMHEQAIGFADNRWYLVSRISKDVYVANHNGETIAKALEGVETLL